MRFVLIAIAILIQAPAPARQEPQAPTQHKSDVTKHLPTASEKSPPTAVNNLASNEKQNNPKEQPKWWMPPPPWDIYWPTFGLVILTGIAACIAIRTLKDIQKQTRTAKIAARAAKKSADAALLSVKALINAERAWIDGEIVEAFGEEKELLEQIIGEKDIIEYSLKIANHGKTPARIAFWEIKFIWGRNNFAQHVIMPLHLLMGSGKIEYLHTFDLRAIFNAHWDEILSKKMSLGIEANIRYFDLISADNETSQHETGFVYRYSPQSGLDRLSADNRYT